MKRDGFTGRAKAIGINKEEGLAGEEESLINWLKLSQVVDNFTKEHGWNSIQINEFEKVEWHEDANTQGSALIMGFGNYEGGSS